MYQKASPSSSHPKNVPKSTRLIVEALWPYINSSTQNKMVGIFEEVARPQKADSHTLFIEEISSHKSNFKANQVIRHLGTTMYICIEYIRIDLDIKCP